MLELSHKQHRNENRKHVKTKKREKKICDDQNIQLTNHLIDLFNL